MANKENPGSDLSRIPRITFAFVEDFVRQNSKSAGSSQLNKGFKYYSEGFISNLKVSYDDTTCRLTAKCYRSQKKNDPPHKLEIFLNLKPVSVESASCDCTIGQSQCCGHVTGALYLVAHYKLRGLSSIPQDVVKTSLPQTWHIPRGEKISGMSVQEVKVTGYSTHAEKRDKHQPIKTTLYNPLRTPLPPLEDLFQQLRLVGPTCSLLTTVPPPGSAFPPTVPTRFGPYMKGSALSYQQKLSPAFVLNIIDTGYPDLPFSNDNVGDSSYSKVLSKSQLQTLESLSVTQAEAVDIEKSTRLQGDDKRWRKMRMHQITASRVGEISKRGKNFEEFANRYKNNTGKCVTAAMRQGIANEPIAAAAYSALKEDKVNIYPSGIVISPLAPWLAATPDRKVFDPSHDPPFGLLEIKCPDINNKELHDLKYLQNFNGTFSLKRSDNYFCQIQMQLAVTGLMWCDLFVWSVKGTHLERITFDKDSWQSIKSKAEKLYFDFIL